MVTAVSSFEDAIGYAFWGLPSFIGKTKIKYLTVDGVDHRVRVDETMDFLADKAHGYRNYSAAPVRLLMVVVVPPGDYDRRR